MVTQSHIQSTRPQTTAHLTQTMTLLGLTAEELLQRIEQELASNPALELVEEKRCPSCNRHLPPRGPCPVCSKPQNGAFEDPIVYVSTREDIYFGGEAPSEDLPDDNLSPIEEDLATYVMRQIATELALDDRAIAAHLLTSLDEDGLLAVPLIDIASYHHVPLARIASIQRQIQRADPLGVGSSNPQGALLIQLEVLEETRPVPPLASTAIQQGMSLLSRHQYVELGRQLGIKTREAKQIARFISENLNPFPARAHWGDIRQHTSPGPGVYHKPDIVISLLNDDPDSLLVVEILLPISGTLRINPLFRKAIRRAPSEKAEQWKADFESATLLVKCIRQRNHTMVRLMRRIALLQRKFILHGDAYLRPTTRASLAQELTLHESTISRAVSGKTVQLPNGRIIPLAQFFDRSLHIRTVIKQIIEEEISPLSDNQIRDMLAERGWEVARRTVAKYRSMEGILPAHLRQQESDSPKR